jgi:hypothetical protein
MTGCACLERLLVARSRHRPWMPAAGNHENELGNWPIGYGEYQRYFSVPPQSGQTAVTLGTPSRPVRCG